MREFKANGRCGKRDGCSEEEVKSWKGFFFVFTRDAMQRKCGGAARGQPDIVTASVDKGRRNATHVGTALCSTLVTPL
jgi:hypothetical protein